MTIIKQLGMRVRYLRKKRSWSQMKLALEADVNKNYICELENAKRNPTLDVLSRIAKAFGITLEVLFKGLEDIPWL